MKIGHSAKQAFSRSYLFPWIVPPFWWKVELNTYYLHRVWISPSYQNAFAMAQLACQLLCISDGFKIEGSSTSIRSNVGFLAKACIYQANPRR